MHSTLGNPFHSNSTYSNCWRRSYQSPLLHTSLVHRSSEKLCSFPDPWRSNLEKKFRQNISSMLGEMYILFSMTIKYVMLKVHYVCDKQTRSLWSKTLQEENILFRKWKVSLELRKQENIIQSSIPITNILPSFWISCNEEGIQTLCMWYISKHFT